MSLPLYRLTRMVWCGLAAVLALQASVAQVNFTGPRPGDVYREYSRAMPASRETWRVSDPSVNTTVYPEAARYLPNPILPLEVDDLAGAIRVEAVISMWGGHIGTTGKKVRFNGNSWINIPELGGVNGIPAGHNGECYLNAPMITIDVPLSHLKEGMNTFEGINAGQACYSFRWGHHGWYNLMLRIYYDPAKKSHPTGRISSPSDNGTIGENPVITTTLTGGDVDRIDVLASYYGYDTDGDGIYTGYHYDYFPATKPQSTMSIRNHVGTATGSSRQVTWNTQWVPDQEERGIKLIARIRDASGLWYCTEEVTGLTLSREGSVKMYVSPPLRERLWARGDLPVATSVVNIPSSESVADATAAVYHIRTWNGIDSAREPGETHYRRFNGWTDGEYGENHFYSYDIRTIPLSELKQGDNTFSFYSQTTSHHGIELLWPGPALMVRYGGSAPGVSPSITTQPADKTVDEGQTATFSVTAAGSSPISYRWQKNGNDIEGAAESSYTTPVVAAADSGARFRVIVSNPFGDVTSNAAVLSVISIMPPAITVHPEPQTAEDGEPASFSVTATGTAPLAYQWQKNSINIAGADEATYKIASVAYADSGALFRCVVSNPKGADTSNAGVLNVTPIAPGIAHQPVGARASVGDTVMFTVATTGSLPLTYQWEKNGLALAGQHSATLSVVAHQEDNGATFRLKVSNPAGSVTSDSALLLVGTFPPVITSHPSQAFVGLGETATFSVAATGTRPLAYRWQRDDVDIQGATETSYTSPPAEAVDNGRTYRCIVTNAHGSDTSETVILMITSDANNLIANPGYELGTAGWAFFSDGSASFANDSTGPSSPRAAHIRISTAGSNVQLYQSGVRLESDTAYTLMFRARSNSGHDIAVSLLKHVAPHTYYGLEAMEFDLTRSWTEFKTEFIAAGFSGTVSDGRFVFWLSPYDAPGDRFFIDDIVLVKSSSFTPPAITRQPVARSANEWETAAFSVLVSGTAPFTFQWDKDGVPIPGATGSTYTTPPLRLEDNNSQYRCVVTNPAGSVTSDPATLTVNPLVSVREEQGALPTEFYLAQNHPNPFNPSTIIQFGLPTSGHVTITVVNLLGQEVATLVDDVLPAGTHRVTFHADRLPSGVYLYRMQSGNYMTARKLLLIR